MLHRRTNSTKRPAALSGTSGPSTTSNGAGPSSTRSPAQNTSFKPLRRNSANLYATPNSGQKARYNLPSPSPLQTNLNGAYGTTSGGYFAAVGGNGYGLPGYESASYRGTSGLGGSPGGFGDDLGKFDWAKEARLSVERLRRGLEDAARLDRSWSLVWGDRELRTLVLKSTLVNLVSLLLLSLSPLSLSPGLSSPSAQHRAANVGLWYNLLLSWPFFVVCFWVNAAWAPDISRRARHLLHPSLRHQPSPLSPLPPQPAFTSSSKSSAWVVGPKVLAKAITGIQRLVLILDFTLVSNIISLVPIIGRPGAVAYLSIIDAYYAFDSSFAAKGWSLDRKVEYMQERVAYMIGFGLPATLLTSYGPHLVTMAVFSLIYPFLVIQALLARPPVPRDSLLPATPSPGTSIPPSPDTTFGPNVQGAPPSPSPFLASPSTPTRFGGSGGAWHAPGSLAAATSSSSSWNDWRRAVPRVPMFVMARQAILALRWLEAALLRDRDLSRRGTSGLGQQVYMDRAGKRLA